MTGRRLYDKFTDALVSATLPWQRTGLTIYDSDLPSKPLAWPLLSGTEKRIWNAMALRITPKTKAVKA